MLTYSRPQGCASDASRLLDFHLTNLNDLSERGYRVEYTIDGVHRGVLSGWAPYRIDGLALGKAHTVRLKLMKPDGTLAPGPFNDTTRTLRMDSGCATLGLIPDEDAEEDEEADSDDQL